MLTLSVQVPAARDRTAVATLREGLRTVAVDNAVASATPAIAARHGNPSCDPLRQWGHPPLGRYRLLNRQRALPEQATEYGTHLLLFEPEAGQALEAEAFGRLALLAYGGPADRERRMRRTQGGLRLTDKMLNAVVARLGQDDDMTLELVPLRLPSWWQFWKRPAVTQPLSAGALASLQPPADEVSVLEQLLQRATRRPRRRAGEDTDDTFDRDRRDDRSSSSRRSGSERFEGKGGEFAGGGASGGWTGAGAGPGVDHAGRILGAAAGAAALGAMAGNAVAGGAAEAAVSGADSGGVSTDGGASGDAAAGGSGGDTATSTSY